MLVLQITLLAGVLRRRERRRIDVMRRL